MQSASEDCSHIAPEDLNGCPFECKTWLNNFPWDATNARFEDPSFKDFLELIENISEVKRLFKSFELTFDKKLFEITDKAKDQKDPNWKVKLVEKLENIKSLPTLNAKELLAFKKLMAEKLLEHIRITKHGIIPNVLLITPNDSDNTKNTKVIYNELNRKNQPITFEDFSLIHKAMPLLEYLSIDSLNISSIGDEKVVVDPNELKSISIKCTSKVESPVGLLIFLLQTYHWSIKSFKLEMDEGKIKQEEIPDDGERINNAFKEISFQFDNLESFELNYFYKSINIAMLLNKLGSTECKLKHICLLGQPDSKNVFYYMIKDHAKTLKSLTVSTYRYSSVNLLGMLKSLEKFSYRWDTIDESVDVFKVLTILPKLKYLELGHDRIQGEWVDKVTDNKVFENLTTLSLYNLQIKEHTFEKLNKRLPNLKNVILTNCRIGVSTNSSESITKFGSYILDSLVLDNCKLFYPKRDFRPKDRSISRFKLSMSYHEPYATTIEYKDDEISTSKLYIDNEYFVYDPVELSSITNTLYIKANLIRSFSISRNASENVTFCPESEIEKKEDADLISEHDIVGIDDDSEDEKETGQFDKENSVEAKVTEEITRTMTEVEVVTPIDVVQKVELYDIIEKVNEAISLLDEEEEDIIASLNKEVDMVQSIIAGDKEQDSTVINKKGEESEQDTAMPGEENSTVFNKKGEETEQDTVIPDKEDSIVIDKKEEETEHDTIMSEKENIIEEEEEEGVFVVSGSDDDEKIEDVPQETQPDTANSNEEIDNFKKYRAPANLFSSDDDESLPNASLPGTPSKPIDQEDEDSEYESNHVEILVNDSDADSDGNSEYSDIADVENTPSKKVIESSDEEYLSDDSDNSIHRSLRKRSINTRSSESSRRKKAKIIYSSEEVEEEDTDDELDNEEEVEYSEKEENSEDVSEDEFSPKYSGLVSEFVKNCNTYKAIIRLPSGKKHDFA